jgi:hypothetical protein
MTEIILLLDESSSDRAAKKGLMEVEGQYTVVDDIEKLKFFIEKATEKQRFIIMNYDWLNAYEHLLRQQGENRQSILQSNAVIFIHGNPRWLMSSLRNDLHNKLNVIGYISSKDSSADYAFQNKTSVLGGIISAIQRFDKEHEGTGIQITQPETFSILLEQVRSNSKNERTPRPPRRAGPA